jgi:hypothetical protein
LSFRNITVLVKANFACLFVCWASGQGIEAYLRVQAVIAEKDDPNRLCPASTTFPAEASVVTQTGQ